MAVSLNILNVSKTFGSTTAVNDVTINIEPGELFFLLGPSGCGKTTLLRSIAGFYVPEKGAITIGDTDVTRLPPHERDNASHWRVRSSFSRAACFSTSRSQIWMPNYAWKCAQRFVAFAKTLDSRRCMSHTIKKRLCLSLTDWPS
jgi:ABC-type branched-subunit amino acid transport system ATPase component